MLILFLAGLAGCNLAGWAAQVIPQKVKATYALPDRPTLVLVDDPDRRLRDMALPRFIAAEISNSLAQQGAVTTVVAPDRIDSLMGKLGDDFDRSAIDQIGREVDANLVVHVYIESATLYPEPGLLQPRAVIQIKVIDAINRRRLFPTIGRADGRSEFAVPSRGKRLEVRLSPRASAGESSTVQAMMMRRLSLRIARDAARLFYDYQPRQPGQRFE